MHIPFVSLIHGARRLHRLSADRSWMLRFSEYLQRNSISHVSCYSWSGGLMRGLRALDAGAYAGELVKMYRAARDTGGSLSIVAKSLGAAIAERALVMKGHDVKIDLFLRIGVPDVRTALRLPGVSRIVNVISTGDHLYRAGLWVMPFFLRGGTDTKAKPLVEIRLSSLSHSELTECTSIDGDDGVGVTTYDLYRRLLAGAEVTEGEEKDRK
jgi:hypothetical protein